MMSEFLLNGILLLETKLMLIEFLNASPGILMGMLNAGSTTLGLLPQNHRMEQSKMRVMTLRSSDDSMTTYLANSVENFIICVHQNTFVYQNM